MASLSRRSSSKVPSSDPSAVPAGKGSSPQQTRGRPSVSAVSQSRRSVSQRSARPSASAVGSGNQQQQQQPSHTQSKAGVSPLIPVGSPVVVQLAASPPSAVKPSPPPALTFPDLDVIDESDLPPDGQEEEEIFQPQPLPKSQQQQEQTGNGLLSRIEVPSRPDGHQPLGQEDPAEAISSELEDGDRGGGGGDGGVGGAGQQQGYRGGLDGEEEEQEEHGEEEEDNWAHLSDFGYAQTIPVKRRHVIWTLLLSMCIAASIIVPIVTWITMERAQVESLETVVDSQCTDHLHGVARTMTAAIGQLRNVHAWWSTFWEDMTQDDFNSLLEELEVLDVLYLETVLLYQTVRPADRAAWEAEHGVQITFRDTTETWVPHPPDWDKTMMPLTFGPNELVSEGKGRDVLHDLNYKDDLISSISRGNFTVASRTVTTGQFAILFTDIVYEDGTVPSDPNERSQTHIGGIVGWITPLSLLVDAQPRDLRLTLLDESGPLVQKAPADVEFDESYLLRLQYNVIPGQAWNLECTPTEELVESHLDVIPKLFVSLAALIVFGSISYMIWSKNRQLGIVEAIVQERTKALRAAIHAKSTVLEDLDLALQLAERESNQKSNFLSFVCHELRNPMHAMIGMTGMRMERLKKLGKLEENGAVPGAGGGKRPHGKKRHRRGRRHRRKRPVAAAAAVYSSDESSRTPDQIQAALSLSGVHPTRKLEMTPPTPTTAEEAEDEEEEEEYDEEEEEEDEGGEEEEAVVDEAEYLRVIKTCSEHMSHLINDVLDLSKMEAGKFTPRQDQFLLKTTLSDVFQSWYRVARKKQINLQMRLSPELPVGVIGDHVRLRQILDNLISNALKFTGHCGFVNVDVSMRELVPGEQLLVEEPDPVAALRRDRERYGAPDSAQGRMGDFSNTGSREGPEQGRGFLGRLWSGFRGRRQGQEPEEEEEMARRGGRRRISARTAPAAEDHGGVELAEITVEVPGAEEEEEKVMIVEEQLSGGLIHPAAAAAAVVGGREEERMTAAAAEEGEEFLLVINVDDNGCGIPPEDLETLFEPYVQTKVESAQLYGGTGLGLAIVKGIVTSLGGRIDVISAVGSGTSFSVTLPIREWRNIPPKVIAQGSVFGPGGGPGPGGMGGPGGGGGPGPGGGGGGGGDGGGGGGGGGHRSHLGLTLRQTSEFLHPEHYSSRSDGGGSGGPGGGVMDTHQYHKHVKQQQQRQQHRNHQLLQGGFGIPSHILLETAEHSSTSSTTDPPSSALESRFGTPVSPQEDLSSRVLLHPGEDFSPLPEFDMTSRDPPEEPLLGIPHLFHPQEHFPPAEVSDQDHRLRTDALQHPQQLNLLRETEIAGSELEEGGRKDAGVLLGLQRSQTGEIFPSFPGFAPVSGEGKQTKQKRKEEEGKSWEPASLKLVSVQVLLQQRRREEKEKKEEEEKGRETREKEAGDDGRPPLDEEEQEEEMEETPPLDVLDKDPEGVIEVDHFAYLLNPKRPPLLLGTLVGEEAKSAALLRQEFFPEEEEEELNGEEEIRRREHHQFGPILVTDAHGRLPLTSTSGDSPWDPVEEEQLRAFHERIRVHREELQKKQLFEEEKEVHRDLQLEGQEEKRGPRHRRSLGAGEEDGTAGRRPDLQRIRSDPAGTNPTPDQEEDREDGDGDVGVEDEAVLPLREETRKEEKKQKKQEKQKKRKKQKKEKKNKKKKKKKHQLGSTSSRKKFSECRVLLVEDDPINRKLIEYWLKDSQIKLSMAENGQIGLDMVQETVGQDWEAEKARQLEEHGEIVDRSKQPFDLIFMDLYMPVMTGFEAAERIRTIFSKEELPIVVLSACVWQEGDGNNEKYQINDFLAKPCTKADVLKLCDRHLSRALEQRSR